MWVDGKILETAFALESTHDLFELLVEKIYDAYVRPGDTAIDGGANNGRHTFPLAEVVGTSGFVLAFEPIPFLSRHLKDKAAGLPQVTIYAKALSSAEGKSTFTVFSERTGWSGLKRRPDATELDGELIDVEMMTLDHLTHLKQLRFMKLDLEGAEFDALKGGKQMLTNLKPLVIFENGGGFAGQIYGHSIEDWYGYFGMIDYAVFDILGRPYIPDYWNADKVPWNSIAVARGSEGERFLQNDLPDIVRKTMRECQP